MGDRRDWLPDSNGVLIEERLGPLSLSTSSSSISLSSTASSNPKPESVSTDRWSTVERVTQGIICQVRPTVVSDERRKAVIDYVQRLIRGYLGCEVFPFGSVPLKTYLPDGDIDLTAFGGANFEDALSNDVFSVLEGEEQNNGSEFTVKDVQVVNAEVKLVKCLVQNIVVDISFNQLGGLCTLCFLEQVDRLIGKDHLFKRSIILIKAWCYYESRILGAHHGLISTYALETLVLYIFHLFHSCLDGPLAVLYRFLDYFSKFDWENYCVSVSGPVRISSLPDVTAEIPENGGLDLLLNHEFLKECADLFHVPSRGAELTPRIFQQKHLNIVDPLKENNNLGRSVSKGNFYRIRSAFTYGARKLGQILLQPEENLADELVRFFTNTLDRHGSGRRPDVHDRVPEPDEKAAVSVASSESVNAENAPSVSGDVEYIPDVRVESLQIAGSCENGVSTSGKALHAPHMYLKRRVEFRVVPDSVSDLRGDLDIHFHNLQYGRYCYGEYGLSSPISQIALPTLTPVASWNSTRRSSHIARTVFSSGANGLVVPRPPFFPMNPPMLHSVAFGVEELPKPRGTGTYFPNTQHQLNRRRYSMGRVRNQVPARSPRSNGRATDANSDWPHHLPSPKLHYPPDQPNGVLHPGLEFGSFARSKPLTSSGKLPNPISLPSQNSTVPLPNAAIPRRKSASSSGDDKSSMYHLKDEDDFPPLSA